MERQVRSPGLVDDQGLAPLMTHIGDRGAGAVRAGTDDDGTGGIGMLLPGGAHLLRGRRVGEMHVFGPPRGDPPRCDPAEDQARDDRLVRITAGKQPARVVTGHGHHRRFHRQRTSAGGEERLIGAHRLGHEVFGVGEIAITRGAVIQTGGGKHIGAERVDPEHLRDPFVGAAALAVPGRGEPVPVTAVVVGQCLQQRCV